MGGVYVGCNRRSHNMKKLAIQLSANETIIHTGDNIYTTKDDFGFLVVRDYQRPPTGGRRDKYLATYNPAFIVNMWDAGA